MSTTQTTAVLGPNRRVVILGAHSTSGHSMKRYTAMLDRAWRESGATTRVITGTSALSGAAGHPGLRKWLGYLEKFVLAVPLIRRASRGVDLVHIADHSDAIWCLLLPRRTPVVVTCHDLFAVRAALGEIPEHRPGLTGRIYQRLVLRGLRRAGSVVSVSAATAADVERLTGHEPRVLHNPVEPPTASTAWTVALPPNQRFALVVSSVGWRKRREHAVEAWRQLRQTEALQGISLVVVGPPLTPAETLLVAGLEQDVDVRSNIPDDALAALYSSAAVALVLSKYEGFGWPIVEAQAHGCPVLATDAPLFREIGGDGCVYLPSSDHLSLTRGQWCRCASSVADPALPSRGSINARRFAWGGFSSGLPLAVRLGTALLPETHEVPSHA
jgi:glycosyltransferase involved in cell wall biosynthesis